MFCMILFGQKLENKGNLILLRRMLFCQELFYKLFFDSCFNLSDPIGHYLQITLTFKLLNKSINLGGKP